MSLGLAGLGTVAWTVVASNPTSTSPATRSPKYRQAYGAPRNPYHRVDVLPSSRHIQILAGQAVVAEASRPVLLIETGVAPRWYIPPGDVDWARLEPVPARTTCQYKGEASYFRVRDGDAELWTCRHPDPGAAAIAGHVATAEQWS